MVTLAPLNRNSNTVHTIADRRPNVANAISNHAMAKGYAKRAVITLIIAEVLTVLISQFLVK